MTRRRAAARAIAALWPLWLVAGVALIIYALVSHHASFHRGEPLSLGIAFILGGGRLAAVRLRSDRRVQGPTAPGKGSS